MTTPQRPDPLRSDRLARTMSMGTSLPRVARREMRPRRLDRIAIGRPEAPAELYLQRATLTRWIPAGHEPVLWVSREAIFRPDAAIRGGIPICFPWFGPKRGDPG